MLLQVIWLWIKKYWSYVTLAVLIAIWILFRRNNENVIADKLKSIQDAHDEELKKINSIREEERKQHVENEAKLKQTLESIQMQYESAKKELDDKKKQEIANIVKKFANDPVALANRLSESTGFTVILPEQ